MPEIQISVNGRPYRVACGPGEEERLRSLSIELDRRVSALVRSFGQVGENQLLLLAALLLSDELDETRAKLAEPASVDNAANAAIAAAEVEREAEELASRALDTVAERLESLAAQLEEP